jgi:hypothetical protein
MTHRNDNAIEILQLNYEDDNSTARWHPSATGDQEFLEQIYVSTRLDSELADAILEDKFDLVLITGNPGDGKTAFLERLNRRGRTKSNRPVEILHDATQPQNATSRSSLAEEDLKAFLSDLSDEKWHPKSSHVRVVGINRGMLARTLLAPQGAFAKKLGAAIKRRANKIDGFRINLIDLNDRALVHLPFGSGDSLFTQILDRLVDPALWENSTRGQCCAECVAVPYCPLLTNARFLRLPRPRRQLELLLGVVQFRRQSHITLRDALAMIAYLVVGHEDMYQEDERRTGQPLHPCDYIQAQGNRENWAHLYRRVFYHAAFNDGDVFEGYYKELNLEDLGERRLYGFANHFLLDRLGVDVDPARVSNEALDLIELSIVSNPVGILKDGVANWLTDLSDLEHRFFEQVILSLQEIDDSLVAGDASDDEYERLRESFLRLSYTLARFAKRRAFFFDRELADKNVTSYESLEEFLGVMSYLADPQHSDAERAFDQAVESTIPGGIIASERITVPDSIDYLLLRWGDSRSSVGARLGIHIDDLRHTLLAPHDKHSRIDERHNYRPLRNEFVEYFPTFAVYRPSLEEKSREHLVINLDLYELLYRLRRGFSEEFGSRKRVQQLRIFKSALKSRPLAQLALFDEENDGIKVQVVVQANDREKLSRARFK